MPIKPTDPKLWEAVKSEYNYIAMMKNGDWVAYQTEPERYAHSWCDDVAFTSLSQASARVLYALDIDYAGSWEDSLVERPKETFYFGEEAVACAYCNDRVDKTTSHFCKKYNCEECNCCIPGHECWKERKAFECPNCKGWFKSRAWKHACLTKQQCPSCWDIECKCPKPQYRESTDLEINYTLQIDESGWTLSHSSQAIIKSEYRVPTQEDVGKVVELKRDEDDDWLLKRELLAILPENYEDRFICDATNGDKNGFPVSMGFYDARIKVEE